MSHVYPPGPVTGLDAYGAGISAYPTVGQSYGQSAVFNVPGRLNEREHVEWEFVRLENIPVDNVLRQLGIEPTALHPAAGVLGY